MIMFWKLVLKLGWKLVEWFWWLKGQRGKMGVKGPNKNNQNKKKDVAHRGKTLPLAAGKKEINQTDLEIIPLGHIIQVVDKG